MELLVNENIQLRTIDYENAARLFPLFKADLKEISQWFPFDDGYQLAYDLAYIDEKDPPFEETFVIYYRGEPCGRIGLYDYDPGKDEIYLYYWVASPYRRRHIAMDSVLTVMEYLKTLGLKTVRFEVKKGNESSAAMIRQLSNAVLVNDEAKYQVYACSI